MKKNYALLILLISLFFNTNTKAQGISEVGSLGVGAQFNSLFYGASAKYNFTEIHTAELVVGGGNYGFGGNVSTFTLTGRYLYNFKESGTLRPYAFGQVGFWSVKFKASFLGANINESNSSIAYGLGGGIEYAFNGLEQLGFNLDLGYGGGSFGNNLSYSGVVFGLGAHFYSDL